MFRVKGMRTICPFWATHKEDKMKKLKWAIWANVDNDGCIHSVSGELEIQMSNSQGTARPLLFDNSGSKPFGIDQVRFAPGEGVALHTHVGSHFLLVTRGFGKLTYYDEEYDMYPGFCYCIESGDPHAIDAAKDSELVLVAVGNDHRDADSHERLEIVEP